MEPLTSALVLACIALFSALIAGSIPMWKVISEQENLLKWMTGMAAGVLLASALLVAIPEGFEIAVGAHTAEVEESEGHLEELLIGGSVLAGFLFMLILECWGFGHDIHEEHHDHADDHGHDHVHHPDKASSVVLGLSIHALTDGLAIGAALASGSLVLTFSVFIAVLAHKVPAAFSVGVFSMHERGERTLALRDVILFSLVTPVMILVTFLLIGGVSQDLLGMAILFAGGTFLYVATVDVLPDVHNSETGKQALNQVVVGAVLMIVLLYALDISGLGAH